MCGPHARSGKRACRAGIRLLGLRLCRPCADLRRCLLRGRDCGGGEVLAAASRARGVALGGGLLLGGERRGCNEAVVWRDERKVRFAAQAWDALHALRRLHAHAQQVSYREIYATFVRDAAHLVCCWCCSANAGAASDAGRDTHTAARMKGAARRLSARQATEAANLAGMLALPQSSAQFSACNRHIDHDCEP